MEMFYKVYSLKKQQQQKTLYEMYLFVHVSAHSIDCIWRSEDNMQESVLLGPGD